MQHYFNDSYLIPFEYQIDFYVILFLFPIQEVFIFYSWREIVFKRYLTWWRGV